MITALKGDKINTIPPHLTEVRSLINAIRVIDLKRAPHVFVGQEYARYGFDEGLVLKHRD
jgi:hypothetical protein